MSVFLFPKEQVNSRGYKEIVTLGSKFDLVTVSHAEIIKYSDSAHDYVYLFLTKLHETWRVPAYLLTRQALQRYSWSDGCEFIEGALLGYSDDQISAWMQNLASKQVNWSGQLIYLMLNEDQTRRLVSTGKRYLDEKSVREGVAVFKHGENATIKKNYRDLLKSRTTIFRVSIAMEFFNHLFEICLEMERRYWLQKFAPSILSILTRHYARILRS